MKVLHFHSGAAFGGIEILLETLARFRHLTPNVTQEFALCFEGISQRRLAATGAMIRVLCPVKTRYPWQLLRGRRLLRQLLVRERFDVVVFHSTWSLAHFSRTVARLGRPFLFWMHNNATLASRRNLLERAAARARPRLVICNSAFTAASLPLQFRQPPPFRVLACPVPSVSVLPGTRSRVRQELGLADEVCLIIQPARIERWKGLAVHLEALGRLAGLPGWHALFAGGAQTPGQHRCLTELTARATELGIADRVTFAGHRDDVRDLLAAADLFCQPNIDPEPFGIGFVEALDAGLPIVSVGHGGVLEIADETCATLLPPPAQPETLAAALADLIRDPAARGRLSARASQRTQAFRPEQILPELAAILFHIQQDSGQ